MEKLTTNTQNSVPNRDGKDFSHSIETIFQQEKIRIYNADGQSIFFGNASEIPEDIFQNPNNIASITYENGKSIIRFSKHGAWHGFENASEIPNIFKKIQQKIEVEKLWKDESIAKKDDEKKIENLRNSIANMSSNTSLLPESTKSKLKTDLAQAIETLSDDMYYFVHQTAEDTAEKIFEEGFKMSWPDIEGTFLHMSKKKMLAIFSDLIDGKTYHRGSTGAFIFWVPKKQYESYGEGLSNIAGKTSNLLFDTYEEYVNTLIIPKQLYVGFFNKWTLNIKNSPK